MPRPGTEVRILDGAGPGGPALDTGTAFIVAKVNRGPLGPVAVHSLDEYEQMVAPRSAGVLAHDGVRAYFTEGGTVAYVSRIAGASTPASGNVGTALVATAASPGAWLNGAVVAIENTTVPVSATKTIDTGAGVLTAAPVVDGAASQTVRYTGTLTKDVTVAWGDGTTSVLPTGVVDVSHQFYGLYPGAARRTRFTPSGDATVDAWAYFAGGGAATTGDASQIGWPAASTTVPQVMAWVGTDGDRARIAYAIESAAGAPRQTLLDQLTPVSTADPADPVPVPVASFRAKVTVNGQLVEVSPWFTALTDATGWVSGQYVRLTNGSAPAIPADGASVVLAGGTTDNAVTPEGVAAAVGRFPFSLGPGQVFSPGITDEALLAPLLAHADATKRVALPDPPDTDSEAILNAWTTALSSYPGARAAGTFGPWVPYPGPVAPGTVRMPYSAIQAGIIARADGTTGNTNEPAAGGNGISRAAVGLPFEIDDAKRERLNARGLNLAKFKNGAVRTYGYRSLSQEPNWRWFANARTLMAIAHAADAIAEEFVLRQIDGQGHLFASLETALRGLLLRYHALGALFGDTPADAFLIDVGPTVNTTATIAAGEVHAVIKVRFSPTSEWVRVDIVKAALGVSLAAA